MQAVRPNSHSGSSRPGCDIPSSVTQRGHSPAAFAASSCDIAASAVKGRWWFALRTKWMRQRRHSAFSTVTSGRGHHGGWVGGLGTESGTPVLLCNVVVQCFVPSSRPCCWAQNLPTSMRVVIDRSRPFQAISSSSVADRVKTLSGYCCS
jgi:hypothetical protein